MHSQEDEHIEMNHLPSNSGRDERNGSQSRRRGTISGLRRQDTDPSSLTAAEERIANRGFLKKTATVLIFVCLWYLFSISITVYNKWMFADRDDGVQVFPFPLFTTCLHMLVQFALAGAVLSIFPKLRPSHNSVNHHGQGLGHGPVEPIDPNKPLMTKSFYLTKIGPCGFFTGLDIGLGNFSLRFITLTFYTMCKSSVLGYVLLFAFLFGLEKPSWKLASIIAMMSVGVFLMVKGETEFKLGGFVLVMVASASSGLRWSLTQILLIRHPVTANPFSTIFFLAPIMFVTLFVLALPVEGLNDLFNAYLDMSKERGSFMAPLILLFPGFLAFCMTASEFSLLQRTSVLTLSICGIVKEALTIIIAYFVFGDKLTTINGIGLVITILTIIAYNYLKITKAREQARLEALGQENQGEYTHVPTADPDIENTRTRRRDSNASGPGSQGILAVNTLPLTSNESLKIVSPLKRPEDLE